jgi:hypothetical protein
MPGATSQKWRTKCTHQFKSLRLKQPIRAVPMLSHVLCRWYIR